MLPKRTFTEQSREEVVKSNLNYSRSKQLWTFSKKQRFDPVRPQCPNAFYSKGVSTLSHKKVSFATSIRRVFTEATDAPLPGTYSIEDNKDRGKRGFVFGEGRDVENTLFRNAWRTRISLWTISAYKSSFLEPWTQWLQKIRGEEERQRIYAASEDSEWAQLYSNANIDFI